MGLLRGPFGRMRFGASSGGAGDALLASITVTNTSASEATTPYVHFGHPFAAAAVPTGSHVEVRKSDGTTAVSTQQYDAEATWSDGSLRFAAFSFQADTLAGSGSTTYRLYSVSGAKSSASAQAQTALRALGYQITLTIGGVTWTATLADALDNAKTRIVKQGPVCTEWRAWSKFKDESSNEHTDLWARWYVAVYADGTTIRIFPEVINGWFANGQAYTLATWALKKGATTIRSGSNLYHWHHSIWCAVDTDGLPEWEGSEPTVHVAFETAKWEAAKAMWHYGTYEATTAGSLTYTPLMVENPSSTLAGDITRNVGAAAQRRDIGFVPGWSVDAFTTQSVGWAARDYINALAWLSAPMHYTNAATGEIAVLNSGTYAGMGTAYPTTCWYGGLSNPDAWDWTGTQGGWGSQATDNELNCSHYPEPCYHPYLRTGYPWLLDGQLDAMNNCLGWGSWLYGRTLTVNGIAYSDLLWGQVDERTEAWGRRTIDNTEYVCPETDPAHDYVSDVLTHNWTATADYIDHDMPAGMVDLGHWTFYNSGYTPSISLPWQRDYIALVALTAYWRGRPNADALVAHLVGKFTFARALQTNGFHHCVPYYLSIKDSWGGTWYEAWSALQVSYTTGVAPDIAFIEDSPGLHQGYDMAYHYAATLHMVAGAALQCLPAGALKTQAQSVADLLEDEIALPFITGTSWAEHPQQFIRPA